MKIKRFCGNVYNPDLPDAKMSFVCSYEASMDSTGNLRKHEWEQHIAYINQMIKGKPRGKVDPTLYLGLYEEMSLREFLTWNIWYFVCYKIIIHISKKLFIRFLGFSARIRKKGKAT